MRKTADQEQPEPGGCRRTARTRCVFRALVGGRRGGSCCGGRFSMRSHSIPGLPKVYSTTLTAPEARSVLRSHDVNRKFMNCSEDRGKDQGVPVDQLICTKTLQIQCYLCLIRLWPHRAFVPPIVGVRRTSVRLRCIWAALHAANQTRKRSSTRISPVWNSQEEADEASLSEPAGLVSIQTG